MQHQNARHREPEPFGRGAARPPGHRYTVKLTTDRIVISLSSHRDFGHSFQSQWALLCEWSAATRRAGQHRDLGLNAISITSRARSHLHAAWPHRELDYISGARSNLQLDKIENSITN